MSCWPLIIVECVVEDLRVEQFRKVGTFLDHLDEVVLEQVGVDIRVLVIDDISRDHIDGSNLVVIEAHVNS
jgi:hypothetical protein